MVDFRRLWILTAARAADTYRGYFLRDISQAGRVNRRILREILFHNRNTEFGRCHFFSLLRTSQQYKDLVPLAHYSDFLFSIQRMAQGEHHVLVADPVCCFRQTAGTSGVPKRIPMTGKSLFLTLVHMTLLVQGLLHQSLPLTRKPGLGLALLGEASSGAYGVQLLGRLIASSWLAPPEINGLSREDARYLQLLFALREPALRHITAPFSLAVLDLFHCLERQGGLLVQDLADGGLRSDFMLPSDTRKWLGERFSPLPERARFLCECLEVGLEGVASRLWPEMLYVACTTGGSSAPSAQELRHYLSDIPIYSASYGAVEALIGLGLAPEASSYVVTPRTAYYEFIPLSQVALSEPKTLDLDELSVGERYEVVVTNWAGLYRYRLGDVVKVVGYYGHSPLIEFSHRL